MDRASYTPPAGKKKHYTRKQIKEIKKNMSRVNEIHTQAQAYQERESKQLPPIDTLLKNI